MSEEEKVEQNGADTSVVKKKTRKKSNDRGTENMTKNTPRHENNQRKSIGHQRNGVPMD